MQRCGVLAVFILLLCRLLFVSVGNCTFSMRSTRRTESDVLTDLVTRLQWASVVVIHNQPDTDFLDSLLEQFHKKGIVTTILEGQPPDLATSVFQQSNSGFLLFGSPDFIEQVFRKVSEAAEERHERRLLFETEWVTITDENSVEGVARLVSVYQNVAVVVRSNTGDLSLWTLRHWQDNSDLRFVSVLPPPFSPPGRRGTILQSHPPLTRDAILPNSAYGLGGRTLRVVVKESRYHVFSITKGGRKIYQGVVMDMLQELSIQLNFSYVLYEPTDDSWGQQLDNGQWDGPIGMLARKEVDLAASLFTRTPGRSSVADPTSAVLYDNAVITYRKEPPSEDSTSFYLQPFQTLVYIAVAGGLAAFLLITLLLEKCRRWTGEGILALLGQNLEFLLAGLVNRPMDFEPGSGAVSLLRWAWLVFGMLLASAYSSKLTSSLTVTHQAPPFTSLTQLLNQDTYKWGFSNGTAEASILKASSDSDYKRFYQGALTFAADDPDLLNPDSNVQRARVLRGGYAYFTPSRDMFYAWSAESCQLTTIPENYMTFSFGFYLQKGSPYTKMISNEIDRMRDAGLIDYWKRKWRPSKKPCDSDVGKSSRVISLGDVQTVFYLAGIGAGVAVLVFVTELFFCRTKERLP